MSISEKEMIIGLISPGSMGASLGAALMKPGVSVCWSSEGRSQASCDRARKAGLKDLGALENLCAASDILLSICPPHHAENVALQAIASGFRGLYVEGNAISPAKCRAIAERLAGAGIEMVDGGIIGGPAWTSESTTLFYLSGTRAADVATLFADSPMKTSIISDAPGAASAMKMAFAAFTKGSTALLSAIIAVADANGVLDVLEQQWGKTFSNQTHDRIVSNATKAWRFVGEMHEIAQTFEEAGLPGGFHEAAAEVFTRLADYKDWEPPPDLNAVLAKLKAKA